MKVRVNTYATCLHQNQGGKAGSTGGKLPLASRFLYCSGFGAVLRNGNRVLSTSAVK